MYKATTPTISLVVPYKATEINKFIITLAQKSIVVFKFTEQDCSIEDYKISFELSQEQSNTFVNRYPIHLQMRVLLTNGKVVASATEEIDVHRVWNDTNLE